MHIVEILLEGQEKLGILACATPPGQILQTLPAAQCLLCRSNTGKIRSVVGASFAGS